MENTAVTVEFDENAINLARTVIDAYQEQAREGSVSALLQAQHSAIHPALRDLVTTRIQASVATLQAVAAEADNLLARKLACVSLADYVKLPGALADVAIPGIVEVKLRSYPTKVEALCTGVLEVQGRAALSKDGKNRGGRPPAPKRVELAVIPFVVPLCGIGCTFDDGVSWCVEQYVQAVRMVNKDIDGPLDAHVRGLLKGADVTVFGKRVTADTYTYVVQLQTRTVARSFVYGEQ